MIRKVISLCICSFFCYFSIIKVVGAKDNTNVIVQNFINAVKSDNAKTVAKYVAYPLNRDAPVPNINNEQEFVEKYDMLFDDDLKKAITDSKPDDWDKVGWRGIMLYSGLLWLNDEGKLIALNGMTAKEKDYADTLTKKDKEGLYPALKNYKLNAYIFDVSRGRGRIDEVLTKNDDEDEKKYRYAFWEKGKSMSDKPDIIINGGEVEYYGSANNTSYIFKNGNFSYHFDITYVGPIDMIPYELLIYRDENLLASYPANIVK